MGKVHAAASASCWSQGKRVAPAVRQSLAAPQPLEGSGETKPHQRGRISPNIFLLLEAAPQPASGISLRHAARTGDSDNGRARGGGAADILLQLPKEPGPTGIVQDPAAGLQTMAEMMDLVFLCQQWPGGREVGKRDQGCHGEKM